MNAEKDINIFSSDADFVDLSDSKIISKSGDLSILSTYYKAPHKFWDMLLFPAAISIYSTVLKGHNISLISKKSGISTGKSTKISFGPEIEDWSTIINSSGDLTLSSGTNLSLDFVNYPTKNKSTTLTAAREVKIGGNKTSIASSESISINGGVNLDISSVKLTAGKEIILNSSQNSKIWNIPITANSIYISTGKDLNVTSSSFNATGNILINSGGNLNLSAIYTNLGVGRKEGEISHVAYVNAGDKLTLIANNDIKLEGSNLISKNDMTLTSGGYTYLKSAVDTENTNARSSMTHKEIKLNSGKNLTILTGEGLLFQATKLLAKGVMNIAAKGGYLYAQAQEDVTEYTTSSSKRKWYGKKKTSTTTHHSVTNKVTEFIADGDINLLSRDDSTYEASKIETNKNATLTSTHGKINFKAVKDSSFEQTISQSKGFFIKNRDSGHRAETWVLPSVHIGGKLTIDAANSISADIKKQKGQSLQAVLTALGNKPETAWLKGLSQRKDIHWSEVQDAYEKWDYKQEHLNPVVSAVIAISVAAVTAGTGLAASAGSSAAGAVGGGVVTQGAVAGGITALSSKVAVSLVENKGNLSKTFKDLSKSDTVKSIATSMAIGGALAGFDSYMGWSQAGASGATGTGIDATKANMPLLSNGDWIKTAQRVAGQSIISSSLNTTINGGSFKDNFATALLASAGNQINAEGANLIGNNGQVLGVPGRMISHAAVSALAAEIGGGDAKGAAAGALAAELAAITLENTFSDPAKIQAGGRIIGGIAGGLVSNSAEGVNSGANSGEITIVYNNLAHALAMMEREVPGTIKAHEESRKVLCTHAPDVCKMAANTLSFGADFIPGIGDIKSFAEAETALDYFAATIGLVPVLGDSASKTIKTADTALKHGDLESAKKLISQVRDEISSAGLFKRSTFEAPSGNNYTVFQQPINWNLPVNTAHGTKTNLDIALSGGTPFVVKDGKYNKVNLHHSKQNGLGPLFELSSDTHEKYRYYDALHPHLPKAHPNYPVDRELFNTDRGAYWIHRAEAELKTRLNSNK